MAIEFKLIGGNSDVEYRVVRIASQAYAIGDAVMWDRTSDAVDVVPATASSITSNIAGVAMEAKTASDTSLLIALIKPDQFWQADVTNAAATNHNMQRMVLTDKGTVNNTGTDSTSSAAVFQQFGVVGTSRIVGRFLTSGPTT